MNTPNDLFDRWVDKVCDFIAKVEPKINKCSAGFQSPPLLNRRPEVVWLGFNPNEPYAFTGVDRKRFYSGNPYWETRMRWRMWRRLHQAFTRAGYAAPITDGRFVLTNAVYFGSKNIAEMERLPEWPAICGECLSLTAELIQEIYRPKAVVCFSLPKCFNQLSGRLQFQDVVRFHPLSANGEPVCQWAAKGIWGDIRVYGIVHPSAPAFSRAYGDAFVRFLQSELEASRNL